MHASARTRPTRIAVMALIACAAVLLLSALRAEPARAGTYPVYACGPAGTAGSGVNHSWGFAASAGVNYREACPSAGVNPNDDHTWYQGMQAYVSATSQSAETTSWTRLKSYVRETFGYLHYRVFHR